MFPFNKFRVHVQHSVGCGLARASSVTRFDLSKTTMKLVEKRTAAENDIDVALRWSIEAGLFAPVTDSFSGLTVRVCSHVAKRTIPKHQNDLDGSVKINVATVTSMTDYSGEAQSWSDGMSRHAQKTRLAAGLYAETNTCCSVTVTPLH